MSAVAIASAIAPRESWRRVAAIGTVAAIAPDLDAVPKLLGHWTDSVLMAHRGLTHSVWFAMAAAACFCVTSWRPGGMSRTRTFVYLAAALLSHGLLDTFSDFGDGIGVALLSPVTQERFKAPWQPITGEISEVLFCLIPLTALTVGVLRKRRIQLPIPDRDQPVSLSLHDTGRPPAQVE